MTCIAILHSGPRSGQLCGCHTPSDQSFCGRHRNMIPINDKTIEYNIAFSDIDDLTYDPIIENKLLALNGYINIRLDKPLFFDDTYQPMVYMSYIESGNEQFTRITLAKEIIKTIEYFGTRPDVYNNTGYSISELFFERIEYDYNRNIYVAIINKI